ncbi:MAG: hypothetical protein QNJ62_04990 [Methyloceanibacter sp.]|nr:hypothetical protein [Methyloceanibacter sp.]
MTGADTADAIERDIRELQVILGRLYWESDPEHVLAMNVTELDKAERRLKALQSRAANQLYFSVK